MTVKRNGDRVILKNGKVSCSCCEEPGECCMYPAQALFDGLYSYQDLPDTLIQPAAGGGNIVFTRLNPPQISEGGLGTKLSYYHGIDSFGEIVGVGLRLTPDPQQIFQWEGSEVPNEAADFGECLLSIQTFQPDPLVWDSLQDQFADTYTVNANLEYPWEEQGNPITIPVNGSFTLERFSLCQWRSSGFPSNAPFFVLNYVNLPPSENPILNEGPQWSLQIYFLEYDPGLFVSSVNFKGDPQNSPVGSYGTGFYGTVSIA